MDAGKLYTTIGHVRRHAVAYYTGFAASTYVPVGAVAATAVHGIRLKIGNVGSGKGQIPITLSLVPVEFDDTPQGYGGHIPYGSGIYTDIPAGASIFRNFAPFVGNAFKLERNGSLVDVPAGWTPADGDVIVIMVTVPEPFLREILFENRAGRAVTATYADGKSERVATVLRPVEGTGRFDGTSFTGVGLINTNHGGVVTVSTAPISSSRQLEGTGPERRGGFEIQPSAHATTQPVMPQAMVVGPVNSSEPIEGKPPIFSGCIGLAYDPEYPGNSVRVEVSAHGGKWEPMPKLVGRQDSALSARGIDKIRILFPRYDKQFLARSLAAAKKRIAGSTTVVRGQMTVRPSKPPRSGSIVSFFVDGAMKSAASQPPYEYLWDARSAEVGDHKIEIRIADASGRGTVVEKQTVVVER